MKRSTFFWNIVIMLITLNFYGYYGNITYKDYLHKKEFEHINHIIHNSIFNELKPNSYNEIPKFSVLDFLFSDNMAILCFIITFFHLVIIVIIYNEKEKKKEIFKFNNYFFLFINPLYVLIYLYWILIIKGYYYLKIGIIKFNDYLDSN